MKPFFFSFWCIKISYAKELTASSHRSELQEEDPSNRVTMVNKTWFVYFPPNQRRARAGSGGGRVKDSEHIFRGQLEHTTRLEQCGTGVVSAVVVTHKHAGI